MMNDKKFGSAGEKIVVEEFLSGVETSILAFVDNDTIVPMVSAKDHKKVYNFEKVKIQEEWVLFLQVKSILVHHRN